MPRPTARQYDRAEWMNKLCAELVKGKSLWKACEAHAGAPDPATVLKWVAEDPEGLGQQYAHARELGYRLLADEIEQLASETHTYTLVPEVDADGKQIYDEHGEPKSRRVLVPLSSDVIAHKRLQIDTRKWMLSKMLPKVYGEKILNEHTGKDGAPIAVAQAVNFKALSDKELEAMQAMLAKAVKPAGDDVVDVEVKELKP